MIHLFCGGKGSGKTKALINLANDVVRDCKGNLVYIDDDNKMAFELDRRIRFISTEEFDLKNYPNFYGFICGILSEDYDIDSIFVDGLLNIVPGNIKDAEDLFLRLESVVKKSNIKLFMNVSCKTNEIPEFIKKYVE